MSNVEHRGALVVVGALIGWLIGRHAGPFAGLAALAILALIVSILWAVISPIWPVVVIVVALGLGVAIDRRHRRQHRAL